MDSLPIENISKIEEELLKKVFEQYKIDDSSLFFDTTNFFTYIHTTNEQCTIAKRGKNKQHRMDLRQIGLAMVVSKENMIPLFHLTYEGNRHDSLVFNGIINKLKERMIFLNMDIDSHTIIFDRGNNSKVNLNQIKDHGFHYVGGLVPYQHKELVNEALNKFEEIEISGNKQQIYRNKQVIWEEERTVIVFISNGLKASQINWLYNLIEKAKKALSVIQTNINGKLLREVNKEKIEQKIANILKNRRINHLIKWSLDDDTKRYQFNYLIDQKKLQELEEKAGIRILMTDRHSWSTEEIIKAYHGQNFIEQTFKHLKNPYHLSIRPQYHWTDQKIRVHYFICIIGYLLAMLLFKQAKEKVNFAGGLDNFLDYLNNIKLAVMLENSDKSGRMKAVYKLEKASEEEEKLIKAFDIANYQLENSKLSGVSVYI
jgi:transposase